MDRYLLDEHGEPYPEPDLYKWASQLDGLRRVAVDYLPGVTISTVFLGLDHSFNFSGVPSRPLLWETMIFGGKFDDFQERYSSQKEALVGHQWAVLRAMSGLPWWKRNKACLVVWKTYNKLTDQFVSWREKFK